MPSASSPACAQVFSQCSPPTQGRVAKFAAARKATTAQSPRIHGVPARPRRPDTPSGCVGPGQPPTAPPQRSNERPRAWVPLALYKRKKPHCPFSGRGLCADAGGCDALLGLPPRRYAPVGCSEPPPLARTRARDRMPAGHCTFPTKGIPRRPLAGCCGCRVLARKGPLPAYKRTTGRRKKRRARGEGRSAPIAMCRPVVWRARLLSRGDETLLRGQAWAAKGGGGSLLGQPPAPKRWASPLRKEGRRQGTARGA
ncbi:hypothetical protein TraAM80_08246 [Trypanosoma rangeli]|uniref:Uncharacterized protein n=1 Tax=Trypanosoma rangeli TaxID=5698 RepID=A0A422N1K1_TRYRA|nr:uncharacterized protein TraAM80_08246 [Trypanosoma rangeli]RNE99335.1 hypothetical protein TraAM80_08246 [Trypanosoma rangeli]|eukprot:RNE99335.1 hypothetical protein TraAM80_08246 [Trypanosoma rangeli]